MKFAFDDIKLESIIRNKIQMLKDYGVNTRSDVACYCYIHNDFMYEDCKYRCNVLKSLNVQSFPMWNCEMPKTKRVKILLYWAWRPKLYWSIDLDEYCRKLHT